MSKYVYEGSIKNRFGEILIRDRYFETTANTKAAAKRNIISQAKSILNLKQSASLLLCSPEAIQEYPDPEYDYIENEPIARCPDCGTRLTDGGYCPYCDDNDSEIITL